MTNNVYFICIGIIYVQLFESFNALKFIYIGMYRNNKVCEQYGNVSVFV